jgi:hypothetical protein
MKKTFPRTTVGGVSVSRMIIGTNWFLGYSHCTRAKDQLIKERFPDYKAVADVVEVFFKAGVDTIMGLIAYPPLAEAIREAEDRTGVKAIIVVNGSDLLESQYKAALALKGLPIFVLAQLDVVFNRGQLLLADNGTHVGGRIQLVSDPEGFRPLLHPVDELIVDLRGNQDARA